MITPSDETTAKRRKVRKGTHSCWECKRRKVKCNFASPHGAICINCHQRNTKCVSQEVIDGSDAAENNWDNTGLTEQAPSWDQPPDTSGGCPRTEHVAGSCAASAFYSALPTPMSTLLCRPLVCYKLHCYANMLIQSQTRRVSRITEMADRQSNLQTCP